MKRKQILVIIRQAPYSSTLPAAALDIVLTAAAFEQEVALLFSGQGVLHLLPEQQASGIGMKDISRALPSLELYEVTRLLADADDLSANGLDENNLLLPVASLSKVELAEVISEADQVFNC